MKVLVVDDDVVSRMVLMHMVDSCGSFEILEAEDGQEAWDLFQDGLRPRICFCDLRMPRLSGIDLLGRVKAESQLAAMPFVLVSSAADRETVEQAMALGADGYITKPFEAGQVQVHIEALADNLDPDESPAHTMRRLGIDAQRLALYLGGLHKQLVAAGDDIEQLLACADALGARARIARLREGCQMLGLAAAAAAFAALEARAPELSQVRPALERARRAVLRQGARTRTLGA